MGFERKIRQALRWMRLAVLADGLAFGAAVAACALLTLVLVSKAVPLGIPWKLIFPALVAGTLSFGAVVYMRRRPGPVHAALALDETFRLEERFTSAWHALRTEDTFRSAILADAERHLEQVHPRRVARWRVRRPLLVFAVVLGAAFALHRYLPDYDLLGLKARAATAAAERRAVASEARKLDEVQKRLAEGTKPLSAPEPKSVAQDLAALQKQFAEGHAPTARDAMAKLSSLADRIDQQKQALKEKAESGVGGKEEAREGTSRAQTADLERALRRGDMDQARAELDRLEEKAAAPGRNASDNAKLGAELAGLAGAVQGQPELSQGLAQAGAGLEKQNSAASRAGFQKARAAMGAIAGAQKEMQQMERALEEIEASKARLAAAANGSQEGESAGAEGAKASGSESAEGGEQGTSGQQGGKGKPGSEKGEAGTGEKSGQPGKAGKVGQEQGGAEGGEQFQSGATSRKQAGGENGQTGTGSLENGETRGAAADGQANQGSQSEQGQQDQQGQQGTEGQQSGPESSSGAQSVQNSQSGQSGQAGQQGSADASQEAGQNGSAGSQEGGSPDKFSIGSGSRGSAGAQSGSSEQQQDGENQSGAQSGGQQQGGASESAQAGGASQSSSGAGQSGSEGSRSGGSPQSSGGSQQGSGASQSGQQGSQPGSGSASAGSSQSGSGQNGGKGQSGSGGQGQGQGGGVPDWGVGSTNMGEAQSYEARAKAGGNRQDSRDSRWTEDFIKLYDARVTKTNGSVEQTKGKLGEGQFQYSVDVEGKARREAPKTGATKAFLDYREAQKDALSQENIPLGYKEFVKDYFDSIEPPKQQP